MEAGAQVIMESGQWAVKLLLEGNKGRVDAKLNENIVVNAIMNIPDKGRATGTHTGKRMSKIKKYKCCGCLVPEYELYAAGTGEFNGMDSAENQVCYKGGFMDDKFNHVTLPSASIEIGNYMRYVGNFQNGLRHGPGIAYVWSTKKHKFRISEEGQFIMDKLNTGRSFPESKPDKYLNYVDGECVGEETLTPPPETLQTVPRSIDPEAKYANKDIVDIREMKEDKTGSKKGNINFGDKVAKKYGRGQTVISSRIMESIAGETGDINFGDGY